MDRVDDLVATVRGVADQGGVHVWIQAARQALQNGDQAGAARLADEAYTLAEAEGPEGAVTDAIFLQAMAATELEQRHTLLTEVLAQLEQQARADEAAQVRMMLTAPTEEPEWVKTLQAALASGELAEAEAAIEAARVEAEAAGDEITLSAVDQARALLDGLRISQGDRGRHEGESAAAHRNRLTQRVQFELSTNAPDEARLTVTALVTPAADVDADEAMQARLAAVQVYLHLNDLLAARVQLTACQAMQAQVPWAEAGITQLEGVIEQLQQRGQ